MGRPVVVIAGRHRPHELLFLAVAVLTGVAYTVGAPPPNSLAASLDPWQVKVWAVGMALSGVVGLVGCVRSLRLEQAGMLLGAGALVWYTAAVAGFGWRALFAGLVSVAWAGANVWRAVQIQRDLRRSR